MPRLGMLTLILLVFAVFSNVANALLINNGVDGDPIVECGPTHIRLTVNTLNPFEGHVFVKGRFHELGCRNSEAGNRKTEIRLGFEDCGVNRVRSLNPRGVFVEAVLITSFHPLFVTKVDRAFKVQCFYMETDKTVEAEQLLDVSLNLDGLSALPEELVTAGLPMPVCRYQILEEGPEGRPILFAEVGQPVYHKWTCDTETVDTFCMVVRDCFVDDKQGSKVDLINSFGCAEDRFLLNNIDYLSDLSAGVGTHVFKYADRPQLAFQCQISIFVKEPNEACPRPYCAEPGGRGAGSENLQPGAPPPAPDHPFPLGPNSPYLSNVPPPHLNAPFSPTQSSLGSQEVGAKSPAEPEVQRAPLPAINELNRHTGPKEGYGGADVPAPAPVPSGYGSQSGSQSSGRSGGNQGARSPSHSLEDGWTAYEGPLFSMGVAKARTPTNNPTLGSSLRSRLYNQYRSKRSAGLSLRAAGDVDVRTELSAAEVAEALPKALAELRPTPGGLGMRGGRVCVSTPALGVFLGAGGVFLVVAIGLLATAVLKTPAKL